MCTIGSKYTHRFCPGVLIFRGLSRETGLGVDVAASVKVIPASHLRWRDGYDDGALLFRLIQAEQSRGQQVGHPRRRSDRTQRSS